LEAMDPDDAADLLSELPEEDKERLLALMRPGDAADVRRLLAYEERTAGGLMTTEPIVLRPDATVADALARVRQSDLSPALAAQVYVCRSPDETPTGKYLGTVHFQRLLRDPPFTLVSSIVDSDLVPLP
ncbi:magnesium transporter, partial [Streptomyces sp. SID8455]|nr:magnesium transporter [Streptomyces sp. SID8455]